jgi:TPR repeat protein
MRAVDLASVMPAYLNPLHAQTPEDDFAQGETEFQRERFDRAVTAWLRAAASGHVEAQFRLGECYTRGAGVLRSLADAALWFKRAAQAGHREAQFRLGLLYLEGSQPDLGAETWLRTASEHDVKATKDNLELLFPNGLRIEPNMAEAFKSMRMAAEAGKQEAQLITGNLYRYGQGCDLDYAKARQWYERAAAAGNVAAEFALGDIFYQGLGVSSDLARGADWYGRAADKGDARAQVALAYMTLTGKGRPQDHAKAGQLFLKAAAHKEVRALYSAGVMMLVVTVIMMWK